MDKRSASDDVWIGKYYERTTAERRVSLERRDRVTHWSYMVLGVFVGAYVVLMVDDASSFWRFALTATILAIMTRFFFQSAIAYGFFLRHRHIQTEIEKHWMDGTDVEEVKNAIQEFDHGKHVPKKNKFVSQLRSGPLVFALPVLLLAIDFDVSDVKYYIVLILLVGYVFYEIVNYAKYDQMKSRA